eukprot:SAG31_NODE_2467_length_5652_cov_3.221862_4_plen_52_part_00
MAALREVKEEHWSLRIQVEDDGAHAPRLRSHNLPLKFNVGDSLSASSGRLT